jgi:hypothetical protein
MKVAMDSDCLIKLTKARAKEDVSMCIDVIIPEIVKTETVDEGKAYGYPDPLEIEKNIKTGKIKVESIHVTPEIRNIAKTLRFEGGEVDVYSMFQKGGFVAIASDDQKFIRKMQEIDIPCFTPSALIILTWRKARIAKERALELLESIRSMISDEEYTISKLEIEKGGEPIEHSENHTHPKEPY